MRSFGPIKIILHPPVTEENNTALAQAVAKVHADAVCKDLLQQAYPAAEKSRALDQLINQ